mmetsp:Transcript_34489/g.34685  ORF Transcript_34489/g.34685 Transcript_34489/m.34685 type:complete len:88 (+) Transcript_34489:294-557(+)
MVMVSEAEAFRILRDGARAVTWEQEWVGRIMTYKAGSIVSSVKEMHALCLLALVDQNRILILDASNLLSHEIYCETIFRSSCYGTWY